MTHTEKQIHIIRQLSLCGRGCLELYVEEDSELAHIFVISPVINKPSPSYYTGEPAVSCWKPDGWEDHSRKSLYFLIKPFRAETLKKTRGGDTCFNSHLNMSTPVIKRMTGDILIRLSLYFFSLEAEDQTGYKAPTKKNKSRKIFRWLIILPVSHKHIISNLGKLSQLFLGVTTWFCNMSPKQNPLGSDGLGHFPSCMV